MATIAPKSRLHNLKVVLGRSWPRRSCHGGLESDCKQ